MNRSSFIGASVAVCLFLTGCSIDWSNELAEGNNRLYEEIRLLELRKAEIPNLKAEIERINEQIVKLEAEKEQILKDNPGIVEYARKVFGN